MADQAPRVHRWQAFLQRATEPVFLLNRQRRLLFVNEAWEKLTSIPAAQARGLLCGRRRGEAPDRWAELAQLLSPPEEVLQGQAGQVRRRGPLTETGRSLWDIEFFSLHDDGGLLGILGKIRVLSANDVPGGTRLPEALLDLHAKANRRYRPETLASSLPALRRVLDQVRLASGTCSPLLIVGEPGTGKRWVARVIHATGPAPGTFATVDCAGLPPTVLARILSQPDGLLHRASMGTVYLKEPAHLPRELQAFLVDWLDETREKEHRPRLVAGCSGEPALAVKAGRLVEELSCALSPMTIHLLPLRERLTDLPDFVERLLERLHENTDRHIAGLTPAAWETLRAYSWPGNLHELYAVLVDAARHATSERIDRGDLPAPVRLAVTLEQTPSGPPSRSLPLDALLAKVEKRLIELALSKTSGNKSRAAELLAIWRPRLLRRMDALGVATGDRPPTTLDEAVEIQEILEELPPAHTGED